MKLDTTRSTFRKENHFKNVRQQQGRVPMDAEWNEQQDITSHRVETEAIDVIGECGAPIHDAGFAIAAPVGGGLQIGAGRYYVHGILCENETAALPMTAQPDFPAFELQTEDGIYVAYLDVWARHLTARERPSIREVALGGPDTATRVQNLWQVELLRAGNLGASVTCLTDFPAWLDLIAPSDALLRARSVPSQNSDEPCIIAPGAGFRRLANQLYRVEIHTAGPIGTATFKYCRENGSILAEWLEKNGDDLTVNSIGRDEVLRFSGGQWVELTDDTRELRGEVGTLVQLLKAEGTTLTIKPLTATGSVTRADFPLNPKIRRWNSEGSVGGSPSGDIRVEIPLTNDGYLKLEDGVEVRFETGSTYRVGDYWTIPARTATGDIEWPRDKTKPDPALPMLREGIEHHYCRLALVEHNSALTPVWKVLSDCRDFFPPLTELTALYYVGGDGQEALPDFSALPATRIPLRQPIQVGVSNGEKPVVGARVQFKITAGAGELQSLTVAGVQVVVSTDVNGVAQCSWSLDSTTQSQTVTAELLDAASSPVHLPVRFAANLSVASEVAYQPGACANLATAKTVQQALDILCKLGHDGGTCCCVTVGKDGDFPSLDLALAKLNPSPGQPADICICMLAGNHVMPPGTGIEIKGNPQATHVRIVGCGPATRLVIEKESFIATGLASFTLRDLDLKVSGTKEPVMIEGCRKVNVEGCSFFGANFARDFLTIREGGTILFADNEIRIETASPDPAALVLNDFFRSEAIIENNRFFGDIRLYGNNGPIDPNDFAKLASMVPIQELEVRDSGGDLQFRGNVIARVTVDKDALSAPGGGIPVMSALNRCLFSNNVFLTDGNQWMAQQVTLSANHFLWTKKPPFGIVIANALIAMGTSAKLSPSFLRYGIPPAPIGNFAGGANLVTVVPV